LEEIKHEKAVRVEIWIIYLAHEREPSTEENLQGKTDVAGHNVGFVICIRRNI
jgi:hypothetical protein